MACTFSRCYYRCLGKRFRAVWSAQYTDDITHALEGGFVWSAQYTDAIANALVGGCMWPAQYTDAVADALQDGCGPHGIQRLLPMLWKAVSCGLHSTQIPLPML